MLNRVESLNGKEQFKEKENMETVKKYLEKRIKQLELQVEDLAKEMDFKPEDQNDRLFRGDCLRGMAKFNLIKEELQQVLKLISDEKESFIKMYGD